MRATQLESSLIKKTLGVETNLNMNQLCALAAKKSILCYIRKSATSRLGKGILPQFSALVGPYTGTLLSSELPSAGETDILETAQ